MGEREREPNLSKQLKLLPDANENHVCPLVLMRVSPLPGPAGRAGCLFPKPPSSEEQGTSWSNVRDQAARTSFRRTCSLTSGVAVGYLGRSLPTRPPRSTVISNGRLSTPCSAHAVECWGRWAAGLAVSWLISTCMRRQCCLFDGSPSGLMIIWVSPAWGSLPSQARPPTSYGRGNPEVQEMEAGDQSGPGAPAPASSCPDLLPGFVCPQRPGLLGRCLLQGRKSSGSTRCSERAPQ